MINLFWTNIKANKWRKGSLKIGVYFRKGIKSLHIYILYVQYMQCIHILYIYSYKIQKCISYKIYIERAKTQRWSIYVHIHNKNMFLLFSGVRKYSIFYVLSCTFFSVCSVISNSPSMTISSVVILKKPSLVYLLPSDAPSPHSQAVRCITFVHYNFTFRHSNKCNIQDSLMQLLITLVVIFPQ